MIFFFQRSNQTLIAVERQGKFSPEEQDRLTWLFDAYPLDDKEVTGHYVGPRKEMISAWSTNTVEIICNCGILNVTRAEEFAPYVEGTPFDTMLQTCYNGLGQRLFIVDRSVEPVREIEDISSYSQQEGLALSAEESSYLVGLAQRLGRKLTDSELFGFSQVNSEHCRHKIFNGEFIIDGKKKRHSLFQLIKKTTETHPNTIVSAYKDNCSFSQGETLQQFAPNEERLYVQSSINSTLSLKAETHNFPTTVEPFAGAATGSGGEIRDRMAGGRGSMPLAGTAVYMTAYPRNDSQKIWEKQNPVRKWKYRTPEEILIRASDGASDYGNKFGQPLICGSVLTFEQQVGKQLFAFDKVVMLAGGIGYGNYRDVRKEIPQKGDKIVLLGGDNYRIGMGGGAVSSVETGKYGSAIELNAVQRSNPEMQRRAYAVVRALAELPDNPILTLHDHGAGGHLNCLSELVEEVGGKIEMSALPVGDVTLSAKEIIGNESQERIGLILPETKLPILKAIAERERAPYYVIGEVTGDKRFVIEKSKTGEKPLDLDLVDFFGNPPQTVMEDILEERPLHELQFEENNINNYLLQVLLLESVACKDWLTNKVDRSVGGLVASQQCVGELQLPLGNVGVSAIDFTGTSGVAVSLGHAPAAALISPQIGSRLAITKALTNIVWASLSHGLKGVSLSANWMWACKNRGEDARLYQAVEAFSTFCVQLGINVPTGKDSLSMTQKYDEQTVLAPGTVIVSASAAVSDIRKTVTPDLKRVENSVLIYLSFAEQDFRLGGSAFAQTLGQLGKKAPSPAAPDYLIRAFEAVQKLVTDGKILAGHDVSSGGLITSLLEMCFPLSFMGMELDFSAWKELDLTHLLFAENPAVILQTEQEQEVISLLNSFDLRWQKIGKPVNKPKLVISHGEREEAFWVAACRKKWYASSALLDKKQSGQELAQKREDSYHKQPLLFDFGTFDGKVNSSNTGGKVTAAIVREKGCQCDRETAYALHLAGFRVKDVHMTDLVSGKEDLTGVQMLVFSGGFSNSDVLGSARGWAGVFKYSDRASRALYNFYQRADTLSFGSCNGCQLMNVLELIYPNRPNHPKLHHNRSHKFESAFVSVEVLPSNSVMLEPLVGMKLGIWVAHGEGRFDLVDAEDTYHIPLKYAYSDYPGNPNGSTYSAAALCSPNGRHLSVMPHIERALFPWQWGYYPLERKGDMVSPWIEAFVAARQWIEERTNE